MSFKRELKEARKRSGLTQQQVAEETHIALGTLRRWEQGVNEPDTNSLLLLLDLYGASADEVLGSGYYKERIQRARALTEDEDRLLGLYRSADARGRATILRAAEGESGVM